MSSHYLPGETTVMKWFGRVLVSTALVTAFACPANAVARDACSGCVAVEGLGVVGPGWNHSCYSVAISSLLLPGACQIQDGACTESTSCYFVLDVDVTISPACNAQPITINIDVDGTVGRANSVVPAHALSCALASRAGCGGAGGEITITVNGSQLTKSYSCTACVVN
jgi:hypothetical protein